MPTATEPELLTGSDDEQSVDFVDNSTALMALNKSEIDTQIATAKQWPRSIKRFKDEVYQLACLDEETAGSMFYVLPRGGKRIEGPSIRMAEVVGSSWGNLRYGARIVGIDDKFLTAQGACFDLEKNIAITVEVKRRITDKNGRRYGDDMITTTANAAMSVALRNAIFKVVPFGLVKPVYEQAKQTSLGKSVSITEQRTKWLAWFAKAGATQAQVLAMLGREGVDDISFDDLITLRGLCTAIRDGDTTIEEAMGAAVEGANAKVRPSSLNEKVGNGKAAATPDKKAAKPKPGEESQETAEPAGEESQETPEHPAESAPADGAPGPADNFLDRISNAADVETCKAIDKDMSLAAQTKKLSDKSLKALRDQLKRKRQELESQ